MKKNFLSVMLLLIAAAIWGFAFTAQSKGMEYIGPMTFSTIRSFIGGALILGIHKISYIRNLAQGEESIGIDKAATRRGGIIAGVMLFFAMNIQQYGILETSVGKAGFITTLYIIIVPIMMRFKGQHVSNKLKICLVLAVVGMYLLSVQEDFSINRGDFIVFVSAIFFSAHMIVLATYSHLSDVLKLNAYQFFVCGVLSLVSMLFMETVTLEGIRMAMVALLYVSVLSSAVAFTCQIIALKYMDTTMAALISSLESIFSAIGGFLILHEVLSPREITGCILVFIATIIAQIGSGESEKV